MLCNVDHGVSAALLKTAAGHLARQAKRRSRRNEFLRRGRLAHHGEAAVFAGVEAINRRLPRMSSIWDTFGIHIHVFQQSTIAKRLAAYSYVVVRVPGRDGSRNVLSGGGATWITFNAVKAWRTISLGSGSIETTIGRSSGPGSSSSSNWLCSKFRGMKC